MGWKNAGLTPKLAIAVLVTLALYVGLSTRGSLAFKEDPGMANYNIFAQSLLAGRLSIGDICPRCLAAGSDARDPGACPPPLIDLVAHGSKYFFLQEPLPVVFHLCTLLILEKPLPTGIAVLLLSCGCLLVFALIIATIHTHFFVDSPKWLMQAALAYFAVSGMQLYMVSRQVIYHETIVAAAFFMLVGTLFFLRGFLATSNQVKWFGLAGVFLGASFASKISMILYPVCFWSLYIVSQIRQGVPFRAVAANTLAFVVPIVSFFSFLMLYNYLRFGDPADFGRTHAVLPTFDCYKYCVLQDNFLRLAHVPHNLATYFTKFPELVWRHGLPWVRFPLETYNDGNVLVITERAASLLAMVPAVLLCLPLPLVMKTSPGDNSLKLLVALCCAPFVGTFLFYTAHYRAVPRYLYEFLPLAYVLVYISLECLWERYRYDEGRRKMIIRVFSLLFAVSALMGLWLGLNGMVHGWDLYGTS